MKRIFALLLSLAVLFSCLAVTAGAMFDPSTVYDVKAQSAYIVNTDTNIIVYEKDSEKQVSAGGLTKYMTIALVLTNYADQLDSTFTMPFAISDYVHNTDNADMRSGETFTYREALYAMVTRNANEAAMGLAYELSGGDLDRFRHGRLRWLGKRDIVVVLGDFGFVWDGSAEEQKKLDWLRKRPYTLLFLDGSHENYDLLAQYPETERFGGRVQSLGGNVYHVCRGSVLELEGKKYLCFGGAESPDREEREPGVNWWKQEMPSDEEYAACEQNLEACGYQVDYVLTHDAPSRFLDFTVLASGETNQLHQFLDKILLKLTYEKWFFGCYHRDVQLSTKSRCVFCDVIPMGERRTGLFRR